MLAGRPLLAQLFAVPLPTPPIHADLNGIFLLSIAAGYLIPVSRAAVLRRTRVSLDHGTAAEGRGAAAFVLDYSSATRRDRSCCSRSSDGALALLTLSALLTSSAADA